MNSLQISKLIDEYYEAADNLDYYLQLVKARKAALLKHVQAGKKYPRIKVIAFEERVINVSAYKRKGYKAIIRTEKRKDRR